MTANRPIQVVYSYAREDEKALDELHTRLRPREHRNQISQWYDRDLLPGSAHRQEIRERLSNADVILLLLSADFLASDYVASEELPLALERALAGVAIVIPILVRPTPDWKTTGLGELSALPRDGKPVASWVDPEDAWVDVTEAIGRAIERLCGQPAQPAPIARELWQLVDLLVPTLQNLVLYTEYLIVAADRYLAQAAGSADATRAAQLGDVAVAQEMYNAAYERFDGSREILRRLICNLPEELARLAERAFVCAERDFRAAEPPRADGSGSSADMFARVTLDWTSLSDEYGEKAAQLMRLIEPLESAVLQRFRPGAASREEDIKAANTQLDAYAASLQTFAEATNHFAESLFQTWSEFKDAARPLGSAIEKNNQAYVDIYLQRLGLMARIQLAHAQAPGRDEVLMRLERLEPYQQKQVKRLLNRLLVHIIFAWRQDSESVLTQICLQKNDWKKLGGLLAQGARDFKSHEASSSDLEGSVLQNEAPPPGSSYAGPGVR